MSDASATPELRPLAVGEIIDRAARFWRSHWRALFTLYLPFQLALYALLKGYGYAVRRLFPFALGGAQAVEASKSDPIAVLADMARAMGALVPTLAVYWLVASFASLTAGKYIASALLGEPLSVRESLQRTRSRSAALLGACALMALWLTGVILAATLPGVAVMLLGGLGISRGWGVSAIGVLVAGGLIASAGLLVAGLWWVLRFLLVSQVLAMEDHGPVAALRRAGALISGRLGPGFMNRVMIRATVLLTASVAILWTAQFITSIPQLALHLVYANPFDPEHADVTAIPAAYLVPAELLQVFAQSVLAPLYVAICAVFYVDQRVRREGLDLELKLARMGPP